jgi:hypothetical protein
VAGGVALLTVCGFGWRVSERSDPIVVVNPAPAAAEAPPTSAPGAATNPLQGVGRPLSTLAAAVVGSYDPASRLVVVPTKAGDVKLGAGRVEELAGQVWAMGPTDPCTIYVTSPDPRQAPKAVKKVDGQPLPDGATPLFDCTPPTTTTVAK